MRLRTKGGEIRPTVIVLRNGRPGGTGPKRKASGEPQLLTFKKRILARKKQREGKLIACMSILKAGAGVGQPLI